uniref:Uncharacterized protein n=1 Tax=Rhizophora mucronata TaxID=61149 RepID=A0A2P2QMS4_RHIMU
MSDCWLLNVLISVGLFSMSSLYALGEVELTNSVNNFSFFF